MQLGKSLVGAIIGGLVGVALCVAIIKLSGWDKVWLAILVALLTGLGVRWMANTKGHPSYARGALTAVIAIAAYFLSFWVTTLVTTQGAAARPITGRDAAPQADNGAADDATEPSEGETETAPTPPTETGESARPDIGGMRNQRPPDRSPWEYVALGIAAFIAYELGRGSGVASPIPGVTTPDDEPAAAPLGQTLPPAD